jgi:hypothetical protein
MDLVLLVYAISLLEGFKIFFGMASVFSAIGVVGFGIGTSSCRLDGCEYSWNLNKEGKVKDSILATRRFCEKCLKWCIAIFILSGLCNIFLPSDRTAYMMVGAYATQKVAENDKVQETGKKVLTLIEQKLDSYIDEGIKYATNKAKKSVNGKD